MVEPIQGEAGVIAASDEFLRQLRALTRAHGLLLIADQIQTGMGRTGRLFACEHAGVQPDVMTLGKGLGGGVPLAALEHINDKAFLAQVRAQSVYLRAPRAPGGKLRSRRGARTWLITGARPQARLCGGVGERCARAWSVAQRAALAPVAFLASDDARSITGQAIAVDDGITLNMNLV